MELVIGSPVHFSDHGVEIYGYLKSINGGICEVMAPNKKIFTIGYIWVTPVTTDKELNILHALIEDARKAARGGDDNISIIT
jgi:hypothetical protein